MVEVTQDDREAAARWLGVPADTPQRRSDRDRLAVRFARHRIAAAEAERGRIVAWLLHEAGNDFDPVDCAFAIENGEHLK